MLYKSKLEKLLKIAWKQVIDNKKLPKTKNSPSWGHLIRESLTYSIAGRNFSYLHHRIKSPFYMKISDKRKLEKFNYSDHKKDFSFQAQTVAFKIKDLTIKYLDNKKKMDKKFADNLIKYWIKYRKI